MLTVPGVAYLRSRQQTPEPPQRTEVKINPESLDRFVGQYISDNDPETVRTLKAGEPLKNDVIFLFTDAEETGSLGAQVFVAEHDWARDVGLALNFEAPGNTGPVIMFESSWWPTISIFAKQVVLPGFCCFRGDGRCCGLFLDEQTRER